jgi:hypothetical protein
MQSQRARVAHERSHPTFNRSLDSSGLQHSDHRLYLQSFSTPSGLRAPYPVYFLSYHGSFRIVDVERPFAPATCFEESGLGMVALEGTAVRHFAFARSALITIMLSKPDAC